MNDKRFFDTPLILVNIEDDETLALLLELERGGATSDTDIATGMAVGGVDVITRASPHILHRDVMLSFRKVHDLYRKDMIVFG